MTGAICFSEVSKSYRDAGSGVSRVVLQDFSLTVQPGELVAFVGPSGIGKTTLLHLAAGIDRPDSGSVSIDLPADRSRIGMVFQQPRLLDWRTVKQNVALATRAAGIPAESGNELLMAVKMEEFADAYPLALSGGERQRVALARAFAIQPGLVLLDEPFSALDELTGLRLRSLLQELWLKEHLTGLLVSHNTAEATFLADRVVVLGDRPCRIQEIVSIPAARPREQNSPMLLEHHRKVVDALLRADSRA